MGNIAADGLLLGGPTAEAIKPLSSKPAEGSRLGELLGWPLAEASSKTSLGAPVGGFDAVESAALNAKPASESGFISRSGLGTLSLGSIPASVIGDSLGITLGWALTEGDALGVELLGGTLGMLLGTAVGPALGAPLGAGIILGKAL